MLQSMPHKVAYYTATRPSLFLLPTDCCDLRLATVGSPRFLLHDVTRPLADMRSCPRHTPFELGNSEREVLEQKQWMGESLNHLRGSCALNECGSQHKPQQKPQTTETQHSTCTRRQSYVGRDDRSTIGAAGFVGMWMWMWMWKEKEGEWFKKLSLLANLHLISSPRDGNTGDGWMDDMRDPLCIKQVARKKASVSGSRIGNRFLLAARQPTYLPPVRSLCCAKGQQAASSKQRAKQKSGEEIRRGDGSPFFVGEGELLLTGVYLTHILFPFSFPGSSCSHVACDLQSCLPLFNNGSEMDGWVDGQFQESRLLPIWVEDDVIRLC
ncbi:hypothetical protein B0T20DRAFT_410134 [Sordaria brevicollis]|uniref:Uncharacterized protein n=1 Tax=Sordaria brevicollis TaxID=83679 RepID=A0AAE0PGP0_SORBR|nr:hypothetical protein B0T20DRAFT_410134 [Sordaria brevicollis]